MSMFNRENGGRANLKAIDGAISASKRPSTDFAKGGRGGEAPGPGMCRHFVSLDSQCPECLDELETSNAEQASREESDKIGIVDFTKLEEEIEPRLPKLAESLGELTYGEMLHFCVETTTGKLVEIIDPMTASPEAQLLARQLHAWLTQRRQASK